VSEFASFLGSAVGSAAGFAAGRAVGPVLEPVLQALKNETWSTYPDAPLDALLMARAVAEGKTDPDTGAKESSLTGISQARFASLVKFVQNGPGVAAGMELRRRGLIDSKAFGDVLVKAGLEPTWVTAYQQKDPQGLYVWEQPLDPAVIANAIVRGIMQAPFELPVGPPTEEGNVKAFPTSQINTAAEAQAAGVDVDRLFVMTAIDGRPMSPEAAASAYFRSILQLADYQRAISEGDVRNEWADAILEHARQILTAHDYAELHLRGWISLQAMYDGCALHGMSQADADLLFDNLGRPIPVHQVTTGLARGGTYNGDTSQIPEAYLRSMQEGNSRPEWYNLEYANRYTLPGYFVVKAMLADGALTVEEATTLFEQEGWPPDIAAKAAQALAGSGGGASKQLSVTQIKDSYKAKQITEADALAQLEAHGYSSLDAQRLLGVAPTVA
jgi:hypothetical protein